MTAAPDPLAPGWQRPRARRDDRVDRGIAAVLLLVAAATAPLFALSVPAPPPWWLHAAWAVAVTAPLAVRRRHPSVVAVVVVVAFVAGQVASVPDGVVSQIAPFLALYSVGAWEDDRRRALVVRGAAVAVLLCWLVVDLVVTEAPGAAYGPRSSLAVLTVLANVLYLGAAVSFGQTARLSARRLAALQVRTEELRAERETVARNAVALERVRIARDLHDVVAHHVSVMGIQAGAARRVLLSAPQEAAACLAAVEDGARSAVGELRRTLVALRAQDEEPAPSEAASTLGVEHLGDLVAESERSGTRATLTVDGPPWSLPPAAGLTLYRVAQEALTNVRKHAGPGARALVRLRYLPGAVELTVDDRGGTRAAQAVGAAGAAQGAGVAGAAQGAGSAPRGSGLGHLGMRERLAAVGGTFEAGATADGYRVRARVPVPTAPTGPTGPTESTQAGRS